MHRTSPLAWFHPEITQNHGFLTPGRFSPDKQTPNTWWMTAMSHMPIRGGNPQQR
jgi:hypothetical protein